MKALTNQTPFSFNRWLSFPLVKHLNYLTFLVGFVFIQSGLIAQTTYSVGNNLSCSNYVSGSGIGLVLEQPSSTQFKFYIVKRLNSSCGINPSGNFTVAGTWSLYTSSGSFIGSASVGSGTGYSSPLTVTMSPSFTSGTNSYYATLTSSGSTFNTTNGGYVSVTATTQTCNLNNPILSSPSDGLTLAAGTTSTTLSWNKNTL